VIYISKSNKTAKCNTFSVGVLVYIIISDFVPHVNTLISSGTIFFQNHGTSSLYPQHANRVYSTLGE